MPISRSAADWAANEASCLRAEELDQRRNSLLQRDLGHIGRWLDAQHWYLASVKVLQQVPVVGRQLNDVARRPEAQAVHDRLRVALGVRKPAAEYEEKYAYSEKI